MSEKYKMSNKDWLQFQNVLNDVFSEFLANYKQMRSGRNKKIRQEAERQVYNNIELACIWIKKYEESFNLLFFEGANDYGKAIIWDEFVRPNWFKTDMPGYLKKVEDKIISLKV